MDMPNDANGEGSLQLLLAEDDPSQRQTISAIMGHEGFEVTAFATARESLEGLETGSFDIAVVDLRLPDLAENELLRKLAPFAEDMPIVLNTGYVSLESARSAVNIGAFAYVEKGSDPAELVRQVHRAVRVRLVQHAEALEKAVAEQTRELREANEQLRSEITERKVAEDALRQSEQKLRSIVEHSREVFFVHDTEHRLTYVSPQSEEVFGYTPTEMQRQWTELLTDNLQNELGYGLTEKAIRSGRRQPPYVLEIMRKDGQLRFVEIDESPVKDENGDIVSITGVLRDITERKRAEEALRESDARFRSLAETSPVGIFQADGRGQGVYVNEAICQFTDLEREKHYGDGWTQAIHPDDRQRVGDGWQAAVAGHGRFEIAFRFLAKNGKTTWVHSQSAPLLDNSGTTVGFIGTLTDVTERRLLEERLRHASKMEAVGQLASGVAHEFNNLLFGILGSAELMTYAPDIELPEQFKRSLQDITKCGQRGAALTRQLLSFARKKVPEVTLFHINEVVSGVENVLRKLAGEFVTLEMALAADLPPIQADKSEIEQALMNLARNARDAMPDGGRLTIRTASEELDEVRVSANSHARPGRYVQLSVADTGCGMAPDTVQRVFEPFFTTKPVGEGTGLGLSTVFADVTRSGGFIEIESRLDEGTVFRVWLPVAAESTVAAIHDAMPSVQHCPGGNETILVCDDDEIVLDSAVFLLEARGYSVIRAGSGREALEVAASHAGRIDLVLTDVTMPEMNGWELVQQLTAERPDVKVIFMSGYAEDVVEAGATAGEHIEFVQKPPEGDALFRRIREVLDAPERPAT